MTPTLTDWNKFNLPYTCLFWCYALNYRSEEFFVLSLLCRKAIPQENFWFQKGAQLLAQIVKRLIQWTRVTAKSRYHLKIGLIRHHRPSRFSLPHFWVNFPAKFKPIVFSKLNICYSHELVYHQKPKRLNSSMSQSPKLSFFHKHTTRVLCRQY